jgi:CBS domain-containing protein
MEVKEAMTRGLITITPDATMLAAAKKMVKHDISGLVVTNHGFQIRGIITKSDIVKAFAAGKKPDTDVGKVMRKKVIVISDHNTLEEAASIMIKHKIKSLPVVSKGTCVGMVTAFDLIKYEEHLLDKLAVLFLLPQKSTQAV